jgi:K+-sensing histidine kinase KdpD
MAWYNQPLVYLFGVLLLALSIYQFSRYQNRKLLKRQAALERMVGEKTRDLKEQNSLLEKNNNIKTRLISIISHDIVTPLKFLTVAGRGLTEKRDRLSEEVQQETIREITDTAQELQLLSTNILNWIKYQSENRRLLPEFFNPHVLTSQVFSVLNSLAKEKGIVLSNQIDPGLKIIQYTEPMKILIYNLVSNSIRYSDRGVIEVFINKTGGDAFVLTVRDNGIGMSDGKVRNILNDDVQVREVSAEKRSGHGLGYLIIKDLVRWMNAQLDIKSKIGVGTEVRVVFRSAKLNPSEMA